MSLYTRANGCRACCWKTEKKMYFHPTRDISFRSFKRITNNIILSLQAIDLKNGSTIEHPLSRISPFRWYHSRSLNPPNSSTFSVLSIIFTKKGKRINYACCDALLRVFSSFIALNSEIHMCLRHYPAVHLFYSRTINRTLALVSFLVSWIVKLNKPSSIPGLEDLLQPLLPSFRLVIFLFYTLYPSITFTFFFIVEGISESFMYFHLDMVTKV